MEWKFFYSLTSSLKAAPHPTNSPPENVAVSGSPLIWTLLLLSYIPYSRGTLLLTSYKPFLCPLSKAWIHFNFLLSDFTISYLIYVIYWFSTTSFFYRSLQNLAVFHSTPKLHSWHRDIHNHTDGSSHTMTFRVSDLRTATMSNTPSQLDHQPQALRTLQSLDFNHPNTIFFLKYKLLLILKKKNIDPC